MAYREFYIGDRGPYFVDDASSAFTDPGQVVQRRELATIKDTTAIVGILKGQAGIVVAAVPSVDYALPFTGLSAVVALAKLTAGGINGSLTFSNGILTAKIDPT